LRLTHTGEDVRWFSLEQLYADLKYELKKQKDPFIVDTSSSRTPAQQESLAHAMSAPKPLSNPVAHAIQLPGSDSSIEVYLDNDDINDEEEVAIPSPPPLSPPHLTMPRTPQPSYRVFSRILSRII
jgi:hypothetical protein